MGEWESGKVGRWEGERVRGHIELVEMGSVGVFEVRMKNNE